MCEPSICLVTNVLRCKRPPIRTCVTEVLDSLQVGREGGVGFHDSIRMQWPTKTSQRWYRALVQSVLFELSEHYCIVHQSFLFCFFLFCWVWGGGWRRLKLMKRHFMSRSVFHFQNIVLYCTHTHVRKIGELLHVFPNVPKIFVSLVTTEVF